jgi:hypothetical protein
MSCRLPLSAEMRMMSIRSPRRALRLLVPAALAAAVLTPVTALPVLAGTTSPASTSGAREYSGSFKDGATYLIQVPAKWNGTLFLYSHGYVAPGSPNPAQDASDPVTASWLLRHGYALAGSSYAITGWSVQYALADQMHTLNLFGRRVGAPKTTIAWGGSLGGMITAGLIQDHPARFSGALPLCGVLSGGVATWNTVLDSEFAFQQLIDPSVQVVNITDPSANLAAADQAAAAAQKTAAGRARLALSAALYDQPGWFTPLSPEPAAADYAAQQANQYLWQTEVSFPFAFELRAQLQAVAGGNPSWNTGVNYYRDLLRSADLREVRALYRAAGLSLSADLATLDRAPRISADPGAVSYLSRYITYNGAIHVPVLTMHTIGDGLVIPENESAYKNVVAKAGNSALLRQVYVHQAGHCAFSPAEIITAARTLLNRLRTGRWNAAALAPAAMNARAARLGPAYNVLIGTTTPDQPSFKRFSPAPFLRPYDRR